MSIAAALKHLIAEPPPSHIFELSEDGVAFASGGWTGFQPIEPGVIEVSPVEDNVRNPDRVAMAIEQLSPPTGQKKAVPKKRRVAVILPKTTPLACQCLDFDSFLPRLTSRARCTLPREEDDSLRDRFGRRELLRAGCGWEA